MRVYVVIGQVGEYSDREEWAIKAFTSKQAAQDFITKFDEFMRIEIINANKFCEENDCDIYDLFAYDIPPGYKKAFLERYCIYDTSLRSDEYKDYMSRIDYLRPICRIEEIDLKETDDKEPTPYKCPNCEGNGKGIVWRK